MTTRSEELFRRAVQVLPGGVSRNTLLRDPHPLYVDKASGCMTTDVEGVERIDFANNMASLIHGHGHPSIVEAVTEQLARGTAFTMATEAEVIFAHHLCNRSPNFDKLRFVNSGTEAVMAGLKAARAFTDRPKIAKIEGTYHGAYDYAEVSQSPQPSRWGDASSPTSVPLAVGTPDGVLADVIVLPFNDPEAATAILDQHRGEIACVLVDPMPHRAGLIPATEAFVRALREWTTKDGSLLMLNELGTYARTQLGEAISITGAPASVSGAGSMYRVHMKEELPWDYRSSFPTQAEKKALTTFVNHLSDAGFLMIYSGAFTLSTPMGRADIDRLAEAAVGALRKSME
jgi:glutamate-1-semialdehyde 2,1-aminomutase